MAANIFEIIVKKGFVPYDTVENLQVSNGDFSVFINSPIWGMNLPVNYTFEGLSSSGGDAEVDGLLGGFHNSDFTESWQNPTSVIGGNTTFESFHSPEGWTINMFSVANNGKNADGSSNSEDDATCGYTYYQGNAHRLTPTLNYVSRASTGTTEERTSGIDDFSFIPDSTTLFSGSGLENTNDVLNKSNISFGSIQGLNVYSTSNTYADLGSNNNIRVTQNAVSLNFLALFGFNSVFSSQPASGSGWSDPTNIEDKWFWNNISKTKQLFFSSGTWSGENYLNVDIPAPIIIRFKDVFRESDLGKYVTVKTTFNNRGDTTFYAQVLTGCYSGSLYNTTGDQVSSTAVDFTVNTSSGAVSSTSDGAFQPDIIHPALSGPIAYEDMTDAIKVASSRLIINKTSATLATSIFTEVNLTSYASYRIFFIVAAVTGDIPVDFSVRLYNQNNSGGFDVVYQELNRSTDDDFGFDFNTSSNSRYKLQIISEGGQDSSVQFSAIRFSRNVFGSLDLTDFSNPDLTSQGTNTVNDFVITTSDFSKDPDSQFGNTEIEGNQGVDVYKCYDSNNNITVKFTTDAYTSVPASSETLIDTREFCNPLTLGSLGTPMLKDEESNKFLMKDVASKDPHGFYYAQTVLETYDVTSTIKIGSKHLNLYQDSWTGEQIVTTNWALTNISFATCKDSFISRDTSGASKLHLYYNPASVTPPPEAILNTNIHNDIIMNGTGITVGYKVDTLTGDPIVLDFGEGTNKITISSTGVGSAIVVPNGSNLRLRTQTAEEKGSAVATVEAVVDYVSLSAVVTGTLLKAEQYGSVSSNNSSLPHIGEYDSALRVYSIDAATLALANSAGGVKMYKNILNTGGADQLKIKINVLYLNTNNAISVVESFSGSEQTTNISATGETIITYNNTPESTPTQLELEFKVNGGGNPLDIKITSIAVEKTFLNASGASTTLDLYDDFEVPINLSVKDFTELSSGSGDYTKTLSVPATKNNMDAVDFIGNINSIHNKDTLAGFPCVVNAEGLPVFEGALHLNETELDEHGELELKLNIVGGNASWIDSLRSLNIRDLTSNEYPISSASIVAIDGLSAGTEIVYPDGSVEAEEAFAEYLNPSIDTEILFPLVNNGRWFTEISTAPNRTAVGWDNVKASYRIKNVLDKIFESVGYNISSTFINGETDFSSEFSTEFPSMFSNLIGIAPSMNIKDSDIINSEVDLQTLTTQQSAFKTGNLGNTSVTNRPSLKSEMLNTEAENPAQLYYCDWVYLKFETTKIDRASSHSLSTISGNLGDAGFSTTAVSALPVPKNQSGSPSTTYSTIRVDRSGYYDLNVAVKANFFCEFEGHFYQSDITNSMSNQNAEQKFTVALMSEDMAFDNIYKTPSSMGALLFDLYDKGWVTINAKNYDNTRLSLTKVQYLEANKDYNIVAISGIKDAIYDGGVWYPTTYTAEFELLEVDFNLKRCKEVAPMKGRNNIVYTNESTPKVSYSEILPDVTALDFISELSKIFNLVWTTNSITKVIEVEPYEDFFDLKGVNDSTPYKDWSDKAVIKNVKENGVLDSDLIYKMANDGSDYLTNLSQGSGLNIGDKRIESNKTTSTLAKAKEKEYSLSIFSALAMDWDTHLVKSSSEEDDSNKFCPIFLPKIWSKPSSTLYPELNEQKPDPNNEHNHKLAYVGQRSIVATSQPLESYSQLIDDDKIINYNLEGAWAYGEYSSSYGVLSGGRFRTQSYPALTYLQASSYSPTGSDLPNLTFADSLGATSSEGGLYNVYHQPLIEMLMMRDKIITADVNLSADEIKSINFRQLINIDGNLYIINKIKDFNFSGEPTEVELLLVTPRGIKEKVK